MRQDHRLPFAADYLEGKLHRAGKLTLKAVRHARLSPYSPLGALSGRRVALKLVFVKPMHKIILAVSLMLATGAAFAANKEGKMVVEYIRYEVPPDRQSEFLAAYAAAAHELAQSNHCRAYEVSQGVEEPNNFIVRIEWDSIEGHEKGFRSSSGFPSFFAKVKPFFAQIREMKHYRVAASGVGTAPR